MAEGCSRHHRCGISALEDAGCSAGLAQEVGCFAVARLTQALGK
jgi:hypothetical protein